MPRWRCSAPGPAPKPGDAANTRYYEIPLIIQDRSFNSDGSLFFPASRDFFFISLWSNFLALKDVFGDSWRESHLPPGYVDIIEEHSIEHYELTEQYRRSM